MLRAAVANFTNCIASSLSPHVLPYFLVGFDIFTAKLMNYVEDRGIGACLYLSVSLPSTRKTIARFRTLALLAFIPTDSN